MLNGNTFPYLVKDFWVRYGVYDESSASLEECQKIVENEELKWKTKAEMGLEATKEVEIRLVVMGINVTITQGHIANLLNLDNIGRYDLNTKESSHESYLIKKYLFLKTKDFGKVRNMRIEHRLLFRILIGCLIPREGSTNPLSLHHKHFIWFLENLELINLMAYIFHHMCEAIKDSNKHNKRNVPYP